MNTQTQQKKDQVNYNKIVNVDQSGEILVLNYVFKYKDGMQGATGTRFEAVSRAEYEERTTLEAITECLLETTPELPDEFKRGGFEAWALSIIDSCEEGRLMYDQSYSDLWDYLREELNLDEENAYIFTCTGGGRCFSADFQGNRNEELSKIIREYESKSQRSGLSVIP